LPPAAPQGLCPEGLMKAALGTGVDIGPETQAGRPKIPFTPPTPAELEKHFPQLEILEFIAQGGMGAVYKARQKQLDRVVALKILPPQAVSGAGFAERFTREARALAKLNHPHIVTLYEFGQNDGLFYFLMEFVDGLNLQQLLLGGRIAPNEALAIVPQICDALQFAHQRGIVHRDIKPGNILLSKEGQVKIADFGVAKIMTDGLDDAMTGKRGGESGELTEAGSVLGTPQYMAPEQVADPLNVDHRADIYSLGVVFYQMLTGELPAGKFEAPSKKVHIDVRLDEVVLRALEKQPELRYQQAGDVKTQLETIASSPGVPPVESGEGASSGKLPRKAGIVRLVEIAFDITFTSALAIRLIQFSALGFLAFLGYVPLPGMRGFFGFSGLFGLIGAAFVVEMAKRGQARRAITSGQPAGSKFQRWFKKNLLIKLPVAFVIAMVIRAFFLQPFRADTDAAAPEIPRGSRFLVWKLTHTFKPGDLIAYRENGWISMDRVVSAGRIILGDPKQGDSSENDVVLASRNGRADFAVPRHAILGKVIAIYWRASNAGSSSVSLRPSSGESPNFTATDAKIEAHALPLGTLLSYAYGIPKPYVHWSENRVILPPGQADGKFDLMITTSDHPQGALQAEIKKQLGLVAHREKRETDVLVLVVANPSLIEQAVAAGGNGSDGHHGSGQWDFANMPIDDVSDFLESTLGKPVINETELTQKFSGSLKWHPQADPAANLKEIQDALAQQFGLELTPAREPVEMLVVEKVK
jgi:uncharacterized protein (TIGR03435 family)